MKNKAVLRYFPPSDLMKALINLKCDKALEVIGYSVENRPIYSLILGDGAYKILAWSQMHGNETTTTKASLDLVDHLINTPEGARLLKQLKLQIIFQLSPDGASCYTRLNANEIDLNRDAVAQSQPEMKALIRAYKTFNPDLCLNLHGQRTIFSSGASNKPATVSFLAPAATAAREVTPARLVAMQYIAAIARNLPSEDHWGIGRYDDAFNINCTGDYFTAQNTPTILFEAGHYPNDYNRDKTRELIFSSLLICLNCAVNQSHTNYSNDDYAAIPDNGNHLRDVEIQNVTIVNNANITTSTLFIQYIEELKDGAIHLIPEYSGNEVELKGLKIINILNKNQTDPVNIVESSEKILNHLQSFIDF
jgi:hypothetical protein